jgi:hypothetical protein
MALILFYGSFLAGAIISLLIPVGLLIAVVIWHTRTFMRVPYDPAQTVPHAAGAAEREGGSATAQDAAGGTGV